MAIWRSIRRMRSRPHRVVQDATSGDHKGCSGDLEPSCWSELPEEMLREVLKRVEVGETRWPSRRSVVAVAGVCRSWRSLTREIVGVPEISGRLTFPMSVKLPGPKDSILQCFIKRNRSSQTYHLYLGLSDALTDDGKFLLAARKFHRPTCAEFIISLQADNISRKSSGYVGKLRSNFIGTKFTVYEVEQSHAGGKLSRSHSSGLADEKHVSPKVPSRDQPVARVSYELNGVAARGPRRMQCIMNVIPATAVEGGEEACNDKKFTPGDGKYPPSLSKSISTGSFQPGVPSPEGDEALVLKNRTPRWHANLGCWCLNFHGRVTVASVKNFQLVATPENRPPGPQHEKVILQFGKVGKDLFTMDFRYPISAFQAFAISLSSFDTRIACD